MSSGRLKLVSSSIAVVACLLAAFPLRAHQHHPRKKAAAKPAIPAPVVTPPPAPLTLQQQPASPPDVKFEGGQLTITADNSVLGEILRAVRSRTGASVDVPPNATERVVGRFGPGPARDVLAALLNGSHFNFIMLGSPKNPTELDRVILISKSGEAAATAAPVSQASATPLPPGQPPAPLPAGEVASAEPVTTDDEDPSLQDQNQPDDDQAAADDAQQQAPAPGSQPGVRTPEQLLQDLQRQQQQIQQQQPQDGSNPNPQAPFPNPRMAPPGMPPFQQQPPQP